MNYLWNILEAMSQWLNALLGGNPNITISAGTTSTATAQAGTIAVARIY